MTLPTHPLTMGLSPDGITRLCSESLDHAGALLARIKSAAPGEQPSFATVLGRFDEINYALRLSAGVPELMAEVHPAADVRESARACEPRRDQFATALFLDREVAEAARKVKELGEPLEAHQARMLDHVLRDFRRNGLELSAEGQARLRDLNERITKVGQDFSKNIAEATDSIEVAPESLEGLPEEYVAAHLAARLPNGNVVISLDYPDYFPFMKFAVDRKSALALYEKFENRAASANVPLLEELLVLRQEKARLLGYANWADYAIEPRMAKRSERVHDFLGTVRDAVRTSAAAEMDELRAMHVALGGKKSDPLHLCDRLYLEERVRNAKYGFDSKELAKYFETGAVLRGLLDITAELYGLCYEPVETPAWHPDVTAYDVSSDGRVIGRFYLDLYPRPNKFKHAAVFEIQPTKLFDDGSRPLPTAALICNFPRPGAAGPALLTHDEVVTFFHEFGHVLHDLLSEAKLASFAGTATARDFVEAPSQMFEEWTYRREILDRFARHHATGEKIPHTLFEGLTRARKFGLSLGTQRQLFLAALDLEYHTREAPFDSTRVLQEIFTDHLPFTFLHGSHFQAAFGHLVGYDAGYYGYQWALSLSRDVLTRFEAEGFLSRAAAADWRKHVLSQGGSEDEETMIERFLGRKPSPEAYLRYLAER